jgi:two-component system chemotaxis response regulator CheY
LKFINMGKTLLVIDDAAIVREKIKETARGAGWEIVGEACNAADAVQRYAALRPAVVTLDLVMPACEGVCALREILAMDPCAQVVVVSALGQKNVLKDAFKLGAADFVVKPFNRYTLVSTLEQFAEGKPAPVVAAVGISGCAVPENLVPSG